MPIAVLRTSTIVAGEDEFCFGWDHHFRPGLLVSPVSPVFPVVKIFHRWRYQECFVLATGERPLGTDFADPRWRKVPR